MKLTTHLYLVLRLRKDGTIKPKPTFLQGMHGDDFIFLKYNHIGLLIFYIWVMYSTLCQEEKYKYSFVYTFSSITSIFIFFYCSTALVGLGILTVEVLQSHSDTSCSVGFLWTSDRPITKTST
jgi:hypothetical protein